MHPIFRFKNPDNHSAREKVGPCRVTIPVSLCKSAASASTVPRNARRTRGRHGALGRNSVVMGHFIVCHRSSSDTDVNWLPSMAQCVKYGRVTLYGRAQSLIYPWRASSMQLYDAENKQNTYRGPSSHSSACGATGSAWRSQRNSVTVAIFSFAYA